MTKLTPQQACSRLRAVLLTDCHPADNATMYAKEQIAACFDNSVSEMAEVLRLWANNLGGENNRFHPEHMASLIWNDWPKFTKADNAFLLLTGATAFEWLRALDW